MRKQSGFTMVELLVVVALSTAILAATAAYAIPRLAQSKVRSGFYDIQECMQLAKVEAVTRNLQVACVIDSSNATLTVLDTRSTPLITSDDEELHERDLPDVVTFARPDTGPAISTYLVPSTTTYMTLFNPDGSVARGTGAIHLAGGDLFGRIQIFAAGGVSVARWDGSNWTNGG